MEFQQNSVVTDQWSVRTRQPDGDGPHPSVLLLHGWTGDENAMWVFASRLPKNAFLIAPRGIYRTPLGGFGWHAHKPRIWPWVDDFQPAIEALFELLTPENFPTADITKFDVLGFSQGAAFMYALGLQHPARIGKMAGLSGFLPDGAVALARNRPLTGKQIFIAHGTQDELVPIERARNAVEVLDQAGGEVTYCEDDVGHKLSANCFNGLERFFTASG